jgi:hypothetical protein
MAIRSDDRRVPRGELDGTVVVAGLLVLALGAAIAVIRFVGGSPAERGLEGALGACALGAVIAAPGALALLARIDRPALLIPAGVLLLPLSGVSMAGATLPLLIPAVMLLVAYGRRRPPEAVQPPLLVALSSAVVIMLVVAALVSLFIHEDPRTWSTPTSSGATSDVITSGEALVSLLLTGAALVLGWRGTAPIVAPARPPSS